RSPRGRGRWRRRRGRRPSRRSAGRSREESGTSGERTRWPSSDDAFLDERGDALVGVADAGEDLTVVLADGWCRAAQPARSTAEARHDGMHGDLAHLVVGRLDDDPAFLDVWVIEELADVVDRRGGDLRVLEEFDGVTQSALLDESADDGVDLPPALHALGV